MSAASIEATDMYAESRPKRDLGNASTTALCIPCLICLPWPRRISATFIAYEEDG